MPDRRKKICVVVASRANLARITTVLEAVRDHPTLELQVIAAASALLDRFGSAVNVLKEAGFAPDAKIRFIIEGQTPTTMAKSTGLGLLELPTAFERLEPDIIVTVADRFDTIATAIAGAYMNIPVAHTRTGHSNPTGAEATALRLHHPARRPRDRIAVFALGSRRWFRSCPVDHERGRATGSGCSQPPELNSGAVLSTTNSSAVEFGNTSADHTEDPWDAV